MKIVSGHFLVRRKGTSEWKPSRSSDEPIEVGSFDGGHKIYLESKGMQAPKAKRNEAPEAPKNSGLPSGPKKVVLHAVVDEQGNVPFAYPDKSPAPDFTEESIKAVKKWTFEPAKLNGQPVAVLIVVVMDFW
jgi:hypothetical protein